MGKILDFIVGNTFVFVGVLLGLLATLVFVILSVSKTFKKSKIPIYEEIDENIELESVKEEDVIEKPQKRVKQQPEIDAKKIKKSKVANKGRKSKDEKIADSVLTEELAKDNLDDKTVEEPEKKAKKKIKVEDPELKKEESKSIFDDELDELEEVEFDDKALREELEKIEDKEIEERIDEEHKKDIEEEIEENDNSELKQILEEMKEKNELDPEEIVRNFEEEQEAQSIISYQELLSVVKQRENDFEDELESRPLATVSDFIKKDNVSEVKPEANVLEMIEKLDKVKKTDKIDVKTEEKVEEEFEESIGESRDMKETYETFESESLKEIPEEGRFKKTEVISPVFGRIQEKNEIDYPKVEKFARNNKKSDIIKPERPLTSLEKRRKNKAIEEEMKSLNAMFADISSKVEEKEKKENVKKDEDEIESLTEISKNEDFLKALKDFRDSL